ncbi:hypothetical protein [Frondihabitans sp. VKM Ac-2883]|uniref:hypothetical protein n=1 Tax=Frondihabitans sp. VKM Ac-2883 TaxID=2783823 RepID=UPI00188BC0B4|nr:hypothetical protein [Frondihabitans sp. VKM Ac-2883]MBF4575479.1 hypothetical protein [Frondihabitans sp. VKM Ac-2883]
MTAVLIAYDLHAPGQSYESLSDKIKSYGTWAKILESTWIVAGSAVSAQGVYEEQRPILDDNDNIFCVEIDGEARQGWLPKQQWDWIRKQV